MNKPVEGCEMCEALGFMCPSHENFYKKSTTDTKVGLKPCEITADCPYGEIKNGKFYTPCKSCPKPPAEEKAK